VEIFCSGTQYWKNPPLWVGSMNESDRYARQRLE
jgi:hypothetical protein